MFYWTTKQLTFSLNIVFVFVRIVSRNFEHIQFKIIDTTWSAQRLQEIFSVSSETCQLQMFQYTKHLVWFYLYENSFAKRRTVPVQRITAGTVRGFVKMFYWTAKQFRSSHSKDFVTNLYEAHVESSASYVK